VLGSKGSSGPGRFFLLQKLFSINVRLLFIMSVQFFDYIYYKQSKRFDYKSLMINNNIQNLKMWNF